jgi:hypothetical protein
MTALTFLPGARSNLSAESFAMIDHFDAAQQFDGHFGVDCPMPDTSHLPFSVFRELILPLETHQLYTLYPT